MMANRIEKHAGQTHRIALCFRLSHSLKSQQRSQEGIRTPGRTAPCLVTILTELSHCLLRSFIIINVITTLVHSSLKRWLLCVHSCLSSHSVSPVQSVTIAHFRHCGTPLVTYFSFLPLIAYADISKKAVNSATHCLILYSISSCSSVSGGQLLWKP
jgi:hypothetical protein